MLKRGVLTALDRHRWLHRIREGALLSVGSSAVMGGCGLVSGLLVARALGVSDRGIYAGLTVIPFLIMAMSVMSVDDAFVRAIGSKSIDASSAAHTTRRWGWLWGLVVSAILWPIHAFWILPPGNLAYAAVVALFAPAYLITRLFQGITLGQGRSVAWNMQRMIGGVVYASTVAILFFTDQVSIGTLLFAWTASYGAGVVISLFHTRTVLVGKSRALDRAKMKSIAGYGAQLSVTRVCGQINQSLDQAFLSVAVSPRELGLYVVAATVAFSPSILVYGYSAYVYSACSRANANRVTKMHLLLILRGLIFSLALYSAVIVVAPWVIRLGFGDSFSEAVTIARILCISGAIYSCSLTIVSVLNALGCAKQAAAAQAASMVVLGSALIMNVARHGAVGAAYSSLTSNAINLALLSGFLLYSRRSLASRIPVPVS